MGDQTSTRRILDEAIRRIWRFTGIQIQGMAQLAPEDARHSCLHAIASGMVARVSALAEMVRTGRTNPLWEVRLAETNAPAREDGPQLRIGVYALAANPLHWGHILVGLTSLVSMGLDRVVFVVAGADPRKPFLLPTEVRHRLAREVIEAFQPFFAYSPIALGTSRDGETNLGRLFELNPRLPMHAFYIAGSDHYQRRTDTGEPDTIEKLELLSLSLGLAARPGRSLSAVFVDRPGCGEENRPMDTFLDVHVLPAMPLACSSSAARNALCEGRFSEALTTVPYATFAEIQSLRLFEGVRACQERLPA